MTHSSPALEAGVSCLEMMKQWGTPKKYRTDDLSRFEDDLDPEDE